MIVYFTLNKNVDVVRLLATNLKRENQVEFNALCVPLSCAPVNDQDIAFTRRKFEHISKLELADSGKGRFEIDLLVGTDFYWSIMIREVVRGEQGEPTAMGFKLGWILNGSILEGNMEHASAVNTNLIHALRVNWNE